MKTPMLLPMVALLAACQTTPSPAPLDMAHYGPEQINAWTATTPAIVESYGQESSKQFGELRLPKGKGPFPVAMLVHGGCWAGMGAAANYAPIADWLAARGLASWNVDYREIGSGGGWPMTFQDWASALAKLSTLGKRYPLDLDRITVVGHSAGATPASWLGSGAQGDGVLVQNLPNVRASVIMDGPIELTSFAGGIDKQVCGRPVIEMLMGGLPDRVPARYDLVDPRKNPLAVEEMLIVYGALPEQKPDAVAAVRATGAKVEIVEVSRDQHFDMLKPGTPDFEKMAPAFLRVVKGR